MRAGLGQVGVIVRARLMLVAAPKSVRRCLLAYRDLATMLADARLLTDSFDVVQGAIAFAPSGEPAFRLDAAKHLDGVGPSDDALLAGCRRPGTTRGVDDRLLRLPGAAGAAGDGDARERPWSLPHRWLMTFVGDSRIEAVVGAELGALDPIADIGPLGQLSIAPLRSQAISSPLFQLPREERCFMCNLVRIPETGDGAEARRLVEANRAAYERIKASGGTLYPVSALPLSALEWREHFGADFGRLRTPSAGSTRTTPSRPATRSSLSSGAVAREHRFELEVRVGALGSGAGVLRQPSRPTISLRSPPFGTVTRAMYPLPAATPRP